LFKYELFSTKLATSWLGRSFLFFEELDSTNTQAKLLKESDIAHGMVVLTDHQKKGRGQYERNWESEAARNLTFSVIVIPNKPERLHVLTLGFARAIADSIEHHTNFRAQLKWPNDVLVNGQKIGGLLTETLFIGNRLSRVIIGIGINVNQKSFSEKNRSIATSMITLTGKEFEREILLADILGRAEHYYRQWHQQSVDLIAGINNKLIGYGEWVHLWNNGQKLEETYKFLGISETGRLVVLNKELEVNTFSYEQIRVQPIETDRKLLS